ncbi:MAG: type II secretion system protein N [Marinobacter sp.]|uniref:type II secretion system protein N n=1 Tax=Marinobacter sp. TaxID=50741 RepID=UPI0032993742
MSETPAKAFLRPGKVFLLTLAGVLIYLVSLVVLVPAGWLWHQASAHIQLPPEIQVRQVSGKAWSGAAGAVVAGYPVRLDWQLGAPLLSELAVPVDFSLATSQSSVNGRVNLGWQGSGSLDASGRLAVAEFEDMIRRSGGAVIEGDVTVDQLVLSWRDGRITGADGVGRWAGGEVTWPMGNSVGRAEFPPMRATLDSTADGVALVVAQQSGDGPAADAEIRWNGMMDLRVYKRMVDLAGQPWPDSASPDDVVFRVRQPLIPGGSL